jgi:hypothetical protein
MQMFEATVISEPKAEPEVDIDSADQLPAAQYTKFDPYRGYDIYGQVRGADSCIVIVPPQSAVPIEKFRRPIPMDVAIAQAKSWIDTELSSELATGTEG